MEKNPFRFNAVLAARYGFILNHLPTHPSRILDLGCGDGFLAFSIATRGHDVVGCDPSITGIQLAERQTSPRKVTGHLAFVHQQGEPVPFEDGSFDVVILADVIEHVSPPAQLLCSARRVLTPGGTLLLSTPCRIEGHVWDPLHEVEYSRTELVSLLQQFFETVRVEEYQLQLFHRFYRFHLPLVDPFRVLINTFALWGWNIFSVAKNDFPISTPGQLCAICLKEK